MSMNFDDVNAMNSGGGSLATGAVLGSLMNRREDHHSYALWSVIIFAIIFIIAIIALAMFNRDRGHKDGIGTDIAGLLATITAANSVKCSDGHYKGFDHEHGEIKALISHSEDRRMIAETQKDVTIAKDYLTAQINMNEKTSLMNFAKLEAQNAALMASVAQLLQLQNNEAVINGVIQKLYATPYMAKC